MNVIKNHFRSKIQVGILWVAALCPLPADFWNQEVFNLPKENQPELVQAIKPAVLDTYRREKLAELLLPLNPRKVYVELPETKAAQNLVVENITPEDNLNRARVLTQYNRNDAVFKTLAEAPATCEVLYLESLAYRRLRRYSDARKYLKKTIEVCEGDFKRKALFLNARIAAMNASDKSLEILNDFLEKYPDDNFTDDVVLWKAHVLKDLHKDSEAGVVLEKLIAQFPNGDMREQAIFERALGLVSEGQSDAGLKLLENLNTAQSTYWRGRLLLYPELASLKINPDLGKQKEGKKILTELAKKTPASYYGYFAGQLAGLKSFTRPQKFVLPKSSVLEADPIYKSLGCLKKAKRLEEAVWIVDRLTGIYTGEPERFILAKKYLELNRPDKAHQLMRNAGLAFPRFSNDKAYPWSLAFPRAYPQEFLKASKKEKLPIDWITGLSREESQFDSQVISWAGAVGLCQLLPSTAHLPENELLNAETNIETGAAHLKELSDELMHPLKAIAAYNAGKVAVKRWVAQNPAEIPMDYFVELIPYEQTRNYVKKVSSAWLSYAWLEGRLRKNLYSL
ncbi:MAG: transglycosylase SLT domain-containing protein [Myxococcaceae bacterium]